MFPVPSVKESVKIRDSWLYSHVGNDHSRPAYGYCYRPRFDAQGHIIGWYYSLFIHGGNDVAAPFGAPIVAPMYGTIRRVDYGEGYGNHQFQLIHEGDHPRVFFFGHASRYLVRDGRTVEAGAPIAEVGDEGSPGAPHLHFAEQISAASLRKTRDPHDLLLKWKAE